MLEQSLNFRTAVGIDYWIFPGADGITGTEKLLLKQELYIPTWYLTWSSPIMIEDALTLSLGPEWPSYKFFAGRNLVPKEHAGSSSWIHPSAFQQQ